MNSAALLLMIRPQSMKKMVILVVVTIFIIMALPVMAVFALGTSTVSFLFSHSTATVPYTSSETVGLYEGPPVPGDTYAWGNCTYWVFYMRLEAGDPIPTTWGNAATWAFYAQLQGYLVDHVPSPGAIMQTAEVDNGLGHVAYVTKVDPTTGAWTISEMNVEGLDIVDNTTYPASYALNFNFIHDKIGVPNKLSLKLP